MLLGKHFKAMEIRLLRYLCKNFLTSGTALYKMSNACEHSPRICVKCLDSRGASTHEQVVLSVFTVKYFKVLRIESLQVVDFFSKLQGVDFCAI